MRDAIINTLSLDPTMVNITFSVDVNGGLIATVYGVGVQASGAIASAQNGPDGFTQALNDQLAASNIQVSSYAGPPPGPPGPAAAKTNTLLYVIVGAIAAVVLLLAICGLCVWSRSSSNAVRRAIQVVPLPQRPLVPAPVLTPVSVSIPSSVGAVAPAVARVGSKQTRILGWT